ncbi:MAG: TorF family putative porin [Pacificimonas sp.]
MTKTTRVAGLAVTALTMMTAAPVLAQTGLEEATETDIPSDWEISGNVGLYSDYRFRGISFSDADPALQGGIDIAHSSGFYVGAWGSNLGGFGTFGDPNLELDLYAGYGAEFGGIGVFDIGVLAYTYPGAAGNNDYFEIYGSIGAEIAGAETTVGFAWDPDQDSIGGDNIYLFGDVGVGVPNTPISLTGHLGYSDGVLAFGGVDPVTGDSFNDNYLDWSLGAEAELFGLAFGVAYVDTDISSDREVALGTGGFGGLPKFADATVVFSIGYSFSPVADIDLTGGVADRAAPPFLRHMRKEKGRAALAARPLQSIFKARPSPNSTCRTRPGSAPFPSAAALPSSDPCSCRSACR